MTRPCPRCHEPLVPDLAILDDARRAQITLDFLPLRCFNGHSARLALDRPRVRFFPTCGYCGAPVFDKRRGGKGGPYLNHPACVGRSEPKYPKYPHRYVEVEANA